MWAVAPSSSLASLTLGYVPGATPAKWARIWAERHSEAALVLHPVAAADAADAVRAGTVDVALLRLPADTTGLAVISLYEETTVAVVPTDHVLTAVDEISAADLDGEPILLPLDDVVGWGDVPGNPVEYRPETTGGAIELVATGMGALIVPQSLARLYHRKDLTYRPITDAPTCPVALAFPEGEQSELVEEFIGIVRGRKASSSRGQAEPAPKRSAREKTLAKQAARAAAGKGAVGKSARKPGQAKRGRR
ncbi:LysR family substrate-binding domain-containing protein [Mycolicibacterium mucogenicum]|uniref:LysR family substrate-binding domain-containing protein n=1 Tax=Mycolicibacterium mucogenicum TaxID=56689 RepID=UPI00226AB019|nr:LysR family substrate-binding domain-containing protein [Mycolicibacterium mucogenicum]MCX8560954.1 LysR family substrate-binding domain-containing protein [Mycolicibacterium mucogenicum]